ncbi:MAG: hypothetical protein ACJ739_16685 [Acidimicrobiales bacterium]
MVAVQTPSATVARGSTGADLAGLAALTVALRLPAFVASTHLTVDDGVFGASAVAMRAGGQPYRDVFSSQGPLFLPLVWVADLIGFRTANAPRVLSLAAALLLVLSTYVAGRVATDRGGALLAGGLVSVAASSLWVTGPLAADGAALAFATATMAMVLHWRDDVSVRRAIWIGLGIGATISVKALLGAVILPAALVLVAGRRWGPIVAGAATAVGFHLVLWLPWGPRDVWEQSYSYHLEVASDRTPGANLAKVLSTMGDRDAIVLVAAVLALGALLLGRRAAPPPADQRGLTSPDALLLAWVGATLFVLLVEHPMWRPHVSQLVPGLALLAARHRPPWKALAVAALVVVPYHLSHASGVLWPDRYTSSAREAVAIVHDLPDGALAISDDPGIVWRSGHRTPPELVDASMLRIETGDITSARLAEVAADDDVCAVVVRSGDRWGSFADLPDRLAALGYRIAAQDGEVHRVYVKQDCRA